MSLVERSVLETNAITYLRALIQRCFELQRAFFFLTNTNVMSQTELCKKKKS